MKIFSINRILILVAVAIASFMALTGGVSRKPPCVQVEGVPFIVNHVDSINALELASWILEARDDYRILDMRDASEYEKIYIPTSENITLDEIMQTEFETGRRLVIVGNNDVETHVVLELLESKGYHGALGLVGGFSAWRSQVLNPMRPTELTKSAVSRYTMALAVSKFFKGETDVDDGDSVAPKTSFAAPPPMSDGKKKKKEGC